MYNFTQNDIENFYGIWRDYCESNEKDKNNEFMGFLKKQNDDRIRLYCNSTNGD